MLLVYFSFSHDSATTELYTLSLHDALPILLSRQPAGHLAVSHERRAAPQDRHLATPGGCLYRPVGIPEAVDDARWLAICEDRKSTRLNSSHVKISYAVFCFKQKKRTISTYH